MTALERELSHGRLFFTKLFLTVHGARGTDLNSIKSTQKIGLLKIVTSRFFNVELQRKTT